MHLRLSSISVLGILVLGVIASATTCAFAQDELRTVALRNKLPPVSGSEPFFSTLYKPEINNAGQVAFRARLFDPNAAPNVQPRDSIWLEKSEGNLEIVALEGEHAPGAGAGIDFSSFNVVKLNHQGDVAFTSSLQALFPNSESIWIRTPDGTQKLLVLDGDPVPGSNNGEVFESVGTSFFLTNSGETLVATTRSSDPALVEYRFFNTNGGSTPVVDSSLPGTVAGESLANIYSATAMSPDGTVSFRIRLEGMGVDSSNDFGLWAVHPSGEARYVAREGDQAPDTEIGTVFEKNAFTDSNRQARINGNGAVAFWAQLSGTGVNDSNDDGIFSEGGDNGLRLIARTGEHAPGTDSGVVFSSFSRRVVINESGDTAFYGLLEGPGIGFSEGGLWSEGLGNGLDLVHQDGTPAPGVDSDVGVSSYLINALGQVLFMGFFGGSSANQGLWAQDTAGVLNLIVRTGQEIDVDNGLSTDLRTIKSLSFNGGSGNEDGWPSAFNDLGQIAFQADFTDGTQGIFVSEMVAIPEPNSALLSVLIAFGAFSMSYRRRLRTKTVLS